MQPNCASPGKALDCILCAVTGYLREEAKPHLATTSFQALVESSKVIHICTDLYINLQVYMYVYMHVQVSSKVSLSFELSLALPVAEAVDSHLVCFSFFLPSELN